MEFKDFELSDKKLVKEMTDEEILQYFHFLIYISGNYIKSCIDHYKYKTTHSVTAEILLNGLRIQYKLVEEKLERRNLPVRSKVPLWAEC